MLVRYDQGRFEAPLPAALNELGPAVTTMSRRQAARSSSPCWIME
jgi:hypothetical protein